MNLKDPKLWGAILPAIEEGQVVPIIGHELLEIQTENGPKMFHRVVAERLAEKLEVPTENLPENFETNDVVCAYKEFHGDPAAVDADTILGIIAEINAPTPEPLRLLAEIRDLRLFISTTFDTLLEKAIFEVRKQKPIVVSFPPLDTSELMDFDEVKLKSAGSMVFQILGRASMSSDFALTEGQVLEQMLDFMSSEGRPRKLIFKLQKSHLLILGVGFPDWLARFLLRISREKPLWDSRPQMEIIADGRSAQKEFMRFMERFSPSKSRLITDASPVEFVRELHRQWSARQTDKSPASLSASAQTVSSQTMSSGSIFVSYAHEDFEATKSLVTQLKNAGLEVWFDEDFLKTGDKFKSIIERNIRLCCAFVPILSKNTQDNSPRPYRFERAVASEVAQDYFGTDTKFYFPVVIDETSNKDLIEYRTNLFGCTGERAPNGNVSQDLIAALDSAQKAYRKMHVPR